MKSIKYLLAILLTGTAVLAGPTAAAPLAPLPVEPQLMLSAGMHTAMLKSVATDADGRYLATVSDDKTARLWETRSGKLVGVLRPPIAAGSEGQLNAVAMSPDGSSVAVAGETTAAEVRHSIYLFERSTGKLLRRLRDLPGEINKLAWSADGNYLAALYRVGGLSVFRTDNFRIVGHDADYPAEGNDLSFAFDNRLVTTAMDGVIRLYGVAESGLSKIKAVKGNGRMPFGVAYAPGGQVLALTYADQPRVEVRSGGDLAESFTASMKDLPREDGGFVAVTWSPDGSTLYAAGRIRQQGRHIARGWTGGGRGAHADLPLSGQVVMGLLALADGRVLYAAADPAWGMIFPDGKVFEVGQTPIADFRPGGRPEAFGVSHDGRIVAFGYAGLGGRPASFDLETRQIALDERPEKVRPPRLFAPDFALEGWKGGEKPTLNGNPIKLRPQETSRSYAIAPDASGLVLGADFSLRRLGAGGYPVWTIPTPGIAWAVNITGDGRFAVVAYGDGSIRWHRYDSGKETLALFPHADGKRWILWTPSGFFDAAPGGDELFGWHLNRGRESAADFFPASRFRDRFFNPELIARILETGDEKSAFKQMMADKVPVAAPPPVAKVLPPVIDIVSPGSGNTFSTSTLTVKTRIRTDAPLGEIRARVNGYAVPVKVDGTGDTREITLTLPERDVEIMLFASNRYATSAPAVLNLSWASAAPPASPAKPKLFLLSVGVSDYVDPEIRLDLAAKDATDFANAMKGQRDGLYREIEERVLLDRKATREAIVDGLKWLSANVTENDVALVFIAGHGMNDPKEGYYYLPADVDRRRMSQTGVKSADIVDALSRLPGRVAAFIDTCHSGNVLIAGKSTTFRRDTTRMVNELASPEHGVVVFTSATGAQVALESLAWGNGAFTKALVEGLAGKASDRANENYVMNKSLEAYVGERVADLTTRRQTPTTIRPQGVGNFALAAGR